MAQHGINAQGNTWNTPGGSNTGGSAFHYANEDGSYYYWVRH